MVRRRIVWTAESEEQLIGILLYYKHRNGNSRYSKVIRQTIKLKLNLLKHQPYIGRIVNKNSIRVLFVLHYHVFYEATATDILIHSIWDGRRNPKSIKYYK
ncbi:MAG: type II toxin-antitoxin system RelE/ParE family toxin [Bacteroidales bacterium]|nr:type II toxin-antitoxin system RelE/ParE family toxin [Bacteroidales bacterium]